MKKLLCLLSAVLIAFTSCSKDDDNNSSDPASSILPKKITFTERDGTSYSENIVYNGNKIVSITGKDYIIKYTYVGDFITKIEEFDENNTLDFTTEYIYTNGKLTSSTRKETGALGYSKIKFVHNTDGTVSYEDFRINSSTNAEDDGGYVGKFTFKDGNLIKNEYSYYGEEKLITYEYDIKNNPKKNILGFNLLLNIDPSQSYVNNLIKKTNISGSGTDIHTFITTSVYEYDANNYATKEVTAYQSGSSVSTDTTEYTY